MTKDPALKEILESFFNNPNKGKAFKINNLVARHLDETEHSRVKKEEIEFLKNSGFTGKNIIHINGVISINIFTIVKALCRNRASIERALSPLDNGGLGFTAQDLCLIIDRQIEKTNNVLSELVSEENFNNARKLLSPIDSGGLGLTSESLCLILYDATKSTSGRKTARKTARKTEKITDVLSELVSEENFDNVSKLLSPVDSGGLGFTAEKFYSITRGAGVNFASRFKNILKINSIIKDNHSKISQEWVNHELEIICSSSKLNEEIIDNPSSTEEDLKKITNLIKIPNSKSSTLTEQNDLNKNQSQENSSVTLPDALAEVFEIFPSEEDSRKDDFNFTQDELNDIANLSDIELDV